MNGLYICFEFDINNEKNTSNGIGKKIYNQVDTFKKYGYKMTFINPYIENNINQSSLFNRILRRFPFYGHFIKLKINPNNVLQADFIYTRKNWFIDYDLIHLLLIIKRINPNLKILMEIPTYPYDHEIMKKSMYPLLIKDKIFRCKLKKYVDRIVTYSNDKWIFGIKTININNAISVDDEIITKKKVNNQKIIECIAVSNLGFWHGYDRVIEGLHNYISNGGTRKIIFHVVGEGLELKKLKELTKKYSLSDYVFFHGKLFGEELNKLYSSSQIGFDSLGRHRSKVYYNSSLKSKEYLCKGVLIVSSVNSELDKDNTFDYILKIKSDDSPVDFNEIIKFYDSKLGNKNLNNILEEMINYAKNNFDFYKSFKPIIEYLENVKCI